MSEESDVDSSSAASASSSSAATVAAFDNRDEETKAKFRLMLGGGKKGKKSTDGKRSKSPSISGLPSSSSASGGALTVDAQLTADAAEASDVAEEHSGENGTEAAAAAAKKKKPRTPKGSQQSTGDSEVSSTGASSSLSSSISNAAHAALERAARLRGTAATNGVGGKSTGKAAAALAALSSRLKHTNPTSTDAASQSNGQTPSLLDPSPSAAASAFSSPNGSPPATPKAVAEEDEEESPVTVSPAAAEETEAEDEDDDEVAADRIEHVEASDAVRNVDRKEHLDAMEKDKALQPTMPWHSSSQPSSTNNAAPAPATAASSSSLLVSSKSKSKQLKPNKTSPSSSVSPQQYGSLVPSPVTSAPTSPRESSDSLLADKYEDDTTSAPRSSSSTALTPYLPFTPSATYFTTAMQPDLTAHGSHIKLILYPIKRQPRKTLLPLQSDQCPQCSTPLRNRMFSRPRYCTYTGLYYCRSCHVKQRCVIPGRVLWFGDVRRYKVCELAYTYLESIYSMPVLPMSAINPSLYRASKRLRYAFLLRQQLVYLRPFIEDCEHREELLVLFGERRYMLNDTPVLSTSSRGLKTSFATIVDASESAAAVSSATANHSSDNARDMYSLRDLMEIIRGQLTEKLSLLVSTLIEHVAHSECESCSPKGRLCEGDGCVDRVPIYSFQVGNVIGCVDCGCLFHRSCWSGEEGECPHCRRVAAAQRSVVDAHRLASELGGGGVRGYGDDSSRARAYVVDESIGHYE